MREDIVLLFKETISLTKHWAQQFYIPIPFVSAAGYVVPILKHSTTDEYYSKSSFLLE